MKDKSKNKHNKWDRLRAENAALRRQLSDIKLVVQATNETKAILDKEAEARRADFRDSPYGFMLGDPAELEADLATAAANRLAMLRQDDIAGGLEELEPPTDMMPANPREPLVDVEPEGERSIGE